MNKVTAARHDLPEVFVGCTICSEMGHDRNCFPPADIAWIGGAWMCAECWDATDEGETGDAAAFDKAPKACNFVTVLHSLRQGATFAQKNPEADYIAAAVAALEG